MDARIIPFSGNVDPRGSLTAIEAGRHVPFPIARVFLVHDVVPGVPRGGHAHRDTDQVIVAAHGSLTVTVTDGHAEESYRLDTPVVGLYVPRMLWVDLLDFTAETSCLVLASTLYDASRSLRTWPDYVAAIGGATVTR